MWLLHFAYRVILNTFLLSADFFQNQLFRKIISGIASESQTVWIQIRPDFFVGPYLHPNCLQRLPADDTSRQRNKEIFWDEI